MSISVAAHFSACGITWDERLSREKILEVFVMCNNNFCGGNLCWIILLIILFGNCGGNGALWGGNNCGCGCDHDRCGCC